MASPDLRQTECPNAVARAEGELGLRLDDSHAVIKRRTWGAPSNTGTWVRIQVWPATDERVNQVPGVIAANQLSRVPLPRWRRGVRWHIDDLVWRADEVELVTAAPVIPAGTLTTDPGLSDPWWRDLAHALDAVATTSVPFPQDVINQDQFTKRITSVFGRDVDTTVTEWGALHGDMAWANLTGSPELRILDWEEFGRGPAGIDHARLWADSLRVPEVADRCLAEFGPYLTSRQGVLCRAHSLAGQLGNPVSDTHRTLVEQAAEQIDSELPRGSRGRR